MTFIAVHNLVHKLSGCVSVINKQPGGLQLGYIGKSSFCHNRNIKSLISWEPMIVFPFSLCGENKIESYTATKKVDLKLQMVYM